MSFICELSKKEVIIVYGNGCYGKTLIEWMQNNLEFVDKEVIVAETKPCDDGVSCIFDLANMKDYSTLVVAASGKFSDEMVTIVKKLGFSDVIVMPAAVYKLMRKELDGRVDLKKMESLIRLGVDTITDNSWGIILDRMLDNSSWVKEKDLVTSFSAAVDNHYMYTLFRILNFNRVSSILDIGMGQTTKLLTQYLTYNMDATLDVVESNADWIEIMKENLGLYDENRLKIHQLDYSFAEYKGESVRIYEGFADTLGGRKYDLISIDAPNGYDMKNYSRIDILSLLPDCLKDDWVILIHDTIRKGENTTFSEIVSILKGAGIEFCCMNYREFRGFGVITSPQNKFICTI